MEIMSAVDLSLCHLRPTRPVLVYCTFGTCNMCCKYIVIKVFSNMYVLLLSTFSCSYKIFWKTFHMQKIRFSFAYSSLPPLPPPYSAALHPLCGVHAYQMLMCASIRTVGTSFSNGKLCSGAQHSEQVRKFQQSTDLRSTSRHRDSADWSTRGLIHPRPLPAGSRNYANPTEC